MKNIRTILYFLISFPLLTNAQTAVEINGHLSVKGNQIVNENEEVVSFAGNSFFWSNKGWGGAKFYNKQIVSWLQKDWNTTIVRCPVAASEKVPGGYFEDPAFNENKLDAVVKGAIKYGLYVIIDWHSHDAHKHESDAITFFKKMAKKYGHHPNIIYEIYNEPLDISWTDDIKPYAENVIRAIRKIDPDNLIIVGTPKWSQDVDIASKDPIVDFSNIAYTLHFYAGTHKESLRIKTQTALNNGIAIMVTEWGTVNANGNGEVDEISVDKWLDFMKKNNLTNCNWAINDKKEGASILKPKADIRGNWTDNDLTESGKLTKEIIQNWRN